MKRSFYLCGLLAFIFLSVAVVGCDDDDLKTKEPSDDLLSFVIKVSEVTSEGARWTITPSDEQAEYVCGVISSASISGKDNAEILAMVLKDVGASFVGSREGTVDNLQPQTDYTVWAVGYTGGRVTSSLSKTDFKTLAEESAPKLALDGHTGDRDGRNGAHALHFTFSCKTAAEAWTLLTLSEDWERALAEGGTMENIVLDNGSKLEDRYMEQVRGDGLSLLYEHLEADTRYTFVCRVVGENHVASVAFKELRTEKNGGTGENPQVRLDAFAGDGQGNNKATCVRFEAQCLSKDAAYAAYMMYPTDQVEEVLNDGATLEEIMNFEELVTLFEKEQMDVFSAGETVVFTFVKCLANSSYTMLLDVKNGYGGRTVSRADVVTEQADGDGPVVSIEAGVGDEGGAHKDTVIWFGVRCESGDAVYAAYYLSQTDHFKEELGSSAIDKFMDLHSTSFDSVNTAWLELFNGTEGLLLQPDQKMQPETAYTFVLEARNSSGGRTIRQAEAVTEAATTPTPSAAPDFEATLTPGDAAGQNTRFALKFEAKCKSGNAEDLIFCAFESEYYDRYIQEYGSEKGIVETIGASILYGLEDPEMGRRALDDFNGGGFVFVFDAKMGIKSDTGYVLLSMAVNEAGSSIVRCDARTDALAYNPDIPGPEVEFMAAAGDENGNNTDSSLFARLKCPGADADFVQIAIFRGVRDQIDQMIQQGHSLADVFDKSTQTQVFEREWVDQVNGLDGITLYLGAVPDTDYTFVADVRNVEGGRTLKRADLKTDPVEKPVDPDQKVRELTQNEFIELVYDFGANPDKWVYKGTKPAVIDFYASWCNHSLHMLPIMEQLAEEYDGRVDFYRLQVDLCFDAFMQMNRLGGNTDNKYPYFVFAPTQADPFYAVGEMTVEKMREYVGALLGENPIPDPDPTPDPTPDPDPDPDPTPDPGQVTIEDYIGSFDFRSTDVSGTDIPSFPVRIWKAAELFPESGADPSWVFLEGLPPVELARQYGFEGKAYYYLGVFDETSRGLTFYFGDLYDEAMGNMVWNDHGRNFMPMISGLNGKDWAEISIGKQDDGTYRVSGCESIAFLANDVETMVATPIVQYFNVSLVRTPDHVAACRPASVPGMFNSGLYSSWDDAPALLDNTRVMSSLESFADESPKYRSAYVKVYSAVEYRPTVSDRGMIRVDRVLRSVPNGKLIEVKTGRIEWRKAVRRMMLDGRVCVGLEIPEAGPQPRLIADL